MKNNLIKINANYNLIDDRDKILFNIKFFPEDVQWINDTGLQLIDTEDKITTYYYNLYDFTQALSEKMKNQEYSIIPISRNSNSKEIIEKTSKGYNREYENMHGKLLNTFYEYLNKRFPGKVSKEAEIKPMRNSIDIYQLSDDDKNIIYEIKTYPDLKYLLRVALGQLLEYGYYPNRIKKPLLYGLTLESLQKRL
jgi:hypothetical protein